MHGIIEGFYGAPWSWSQRREVATALSGAGMDTYVYAPKDDPLGPSPSRPGWAATAP